MELVSDTTPSEDAARLKAGESLTMLGGPGTGKTRALALTFEALLAAGMDVDDILVLAPTRPRADALREQLSRGLGGARSGPLARTPHSLAFGLLSAHASAARGENLRFISGAEQDAMLADLLAGHERGEGRIPSWPARITPEIRSTQAFRAQLRDVLNRAMEWGLSPEALEAAAADGRDVWRACGQVLAEYEQLTLFGDATSMDPAGVLTEATALVRDAVNGTAPGEAPWFTTWRVPRVVLLDDAQDVTEAAGRLLDALVECGSVVAVYASPDTVTSGFRGVRAEVALEAAGVAAGAGGTPRFAGPAGHRTVVLHVNRRSKPSLARLAASWARSTTRATRMHAALPGPPEAPGESVDGVEARLTRSPEAEAALIASHVREHHLGPARLPYGQMAVVARSGAALRDIERALRAQGVPVHSSAPEVPLREHRATAPLLELLRGRPDDLSTAGESLLLSVYGGLDRLALRRLRRALRSQRRAREQEGQLDPDEIVAWALREPEPPTLRHPGYSRALARVHAMVHAATDEGDPAGALWSIWQASGVARRWQERALAGEAGSAAADDDLDAVMRLFALAEKFVDTTPGASASVFADEVRAQSLAQDSLAAQSAERDAVTVTTVAGAAGGEWELVVVPGLQAGRWPNVGIRGSILGADDIPSIVRGRPVPGSDLESIARERKEVLRDEAALLLAAVSRARSRLLLTAVDSAEARPSVFFEALVDLVRGDDGSSASPSEASWPSVGDYPMPLTLRGLAGRARRAAEEALEADETESALVSARVVAELARAGVPGAAPHEWLGVAQVSSGEPVSRGTRVSVSPSSVEQFETCSLRWFLERHGGSRPQGAAQAMGTLVHAIAERQPLGTREELLAGFEEGFEGLEFATEWEREAARERGRGMVEALAAYQTSHRHEYRGSEVSLEVDVDPEGGVPFRLRGSIDRVDSREGGLQVVDFKTGGSAVTKDVASASGQLLSYQLALALGRARWDGDRVVGIETGPDEATQPAGAELVYVGTGKPSVRAQEALGEKVPEATRRLALVAEGMSGRAFLATPNPGCDHCPVRRACPATIERSGP